MRKTHLYRILEVKAHRMVGQHRHNKSDPKGSGHSLVGLLTLYVHNATVIYDCTKTMNNIKQIIPHITEKEFLFCLILFYSVLNFFACQIQG